MAVLEWLMPGALGSFIAAAFFREKGPVEMGLSVVSGTACAYYFGPFIAEVLGLSANGRSALGFAVGLTGMFLIGGLINAARAFQKDPWSAWDRLRGRGGPTQP